MPSTKMTDPHVVYLRYAVECDNEVDFRADPAELETDDFSIRIADDGQVPGIVARTSTRLVDAPEDEPETLLLETEAVVTMKRHYATVEEAQLAVEPYLRAWAVEATLHGAPRFRFVEVGDLVVERDPPPGEPPTYHVSGGGSFRVVQPPRSIAIDAYPLLSGQFVLDVHAETVWGRWEKYVDGSETITGAAYAILTYLENVFGTGRADAARRLNVSRNVLDRLGPLVSRTGDARTTRKFDSEAFGRPHTDDEIAWIEALITEIARRLGVLAAGGSPAELTLSDLPRLCVPRSGFAPLPDL